MQTHTQTYTCAHTYITRCSHIHFDTHTHTHTQLGIAGEPGSFYCLTGGSVSPEQQVRVVMMMMVVVVNVPESVLLLLPWSLLLQPLLISREESPTPLMTPIDTDAHHKQPGQEETSVKSEIIIIFIMFCALSRTPGASPRRLQNHNELESEECFGGRREGAYF